MSVTVAVDAMGGDHGPPVTVPACFAFPRGGAACARRARRNVGAARGGAGEGAPASARSHHDPRGHRSRRHGRAAGRRVAQEEGFVDARRDQPRQGRHGARVRFGRQYRRADGDRALRAEDAARHRPSRDRVAIADQDRRHAGARPRRQRQLHRRATCAVRRDGQRAGLCRRRHRAPDGRTAQHRRRGHQGQRRRQAGGGAPEGVDTQFLRQRRRRRHLHGHDRRRRLRRLRRQRHAEDVRRPRAHALRVPEDGIHAQPADARRGRCRVSGADVVQAPHRPAPLQRRDAGRIERRRRQEPRRRRRVRVRATRCGAPPPKSSTACSTRSRSGSPKCPTCDPSNDGDPGPLRAHA